MPKNVLITRPILGPGPELLAAAGHKVTVSPHDRSLTAQELLAAAHGMDGILTTGSNLITPAFLDACPTIRAVSNMAVGFNNIDVPACTARRVGAANTPDIPTDATAEIAFLLILAAARRAGEGERCVRTGTWGGYAPCEFLGVDVVGQTLGLIGAGRIGARVARMAQGFDMKLLYHNRKPNPELDRLGATYLPLEKLLQQSDFVSVHAPLTSETRHLIGAAQLALMKPTAVLVNTARGPLVDEAALVAALQAKKIFAAGLDVYEEEPKVHPGLFTLDNAVLLPHIGSATVPTRMKMSRLAAENLLAMLDGKRPKAPLNPELWEAPDHPK